MQCNQECMGCGECVCCCQCGLDWDYFPDQVAGVTMQGAAVWQRYDMDSQWADDLFERDSVVVAVDDTEVFDKNFLVGGSEFTVGVGRWLATLNGADTWAKKNPLRNGYREASHVRWSAVQAGYGETPWSEKHKVHDRKPRWKK